MGVADWKICSGHALDFFINHVVLYCLDFFSKVSSEEQDVILILLKNTSVIIIYYYTRQASLNNFTGMY